MSNQGENAEETAYAGRWVARFDGHVVAHGGTPEQARRAAQMSRPKEKPEIVYMQPSPLLSLSPLVDRVRAALPDEEIYLVGGAVRDALRGKVSHDLDFAVPSNAIATARHVADALHADFYILDESFDTARVIVTMAPEATGATSDAPSQARMVRELLDFSGYRSAPGSSVTHSGILEADLRGRDFTINAIAYDLRAGVILDPLGGAGDLRAKMIRAASATAMQDDAIRILRGVRLAAALEFRIDKVTRTAMRAAARLLPGISPERQRDELFKILDGPRPDTSLRALEMLGVFPYLAPELSGMKGVEQSAPHVAAVWEHTLSVIHYLSGIIDALKVDYDAEGASDLYAGLLSLRLGRYRDRFAQHLQRALNPDRSLRALLLFAALYHDVSKPETKSMDQTGRIRFFGHEGRGAEQAASRARAFNLSNDETERLQVIVANHMRFHFHVHKLESEGRLPSRRAIYRFFRDTGDAGVELMLLGLADLRGTRGNLLDQGTWLKALEVARVFLENYWERPEEAVAPPRLVDGNVLMAALDLESGPIVGQVLEAIREAQATGQVADKESALAFARDWLAARDQDS